MWIEFYDEGCFTEARVVTAERALEIYRKHAPKEDLIEGAVYCDDNFFPFLAWAKPLPKDEE